MIEARRFGKRLVLPSTVQIVRELKLLMGAEAAHEQAVRAAAVKEAGEQGPSRAEASPV